MSQRDIVLQHKHLWPAMPTHFLNQNPDAIQLGDLLCIHLVGREKAFPSPNWIDMHPPRTAHGLYHQQFVQHEQKIRGLIEFNPSGLCLVS